MVTAVTGFLFAIIAIILILMSVSFNMIIDRLDSLEKQIKEATKKQKAPTEAGAN